MSGKSKWSPKRKERQAANWLKARERDKKKAEEVADRERVNRALRVASEGTEWETQQYNRKQRRRHLQPVQYTGTGGWQHEL